MISCICLFYISALARTIAAPSPDALYADRTNLASAQQAADLWAADLAHNPSNYVAAWKLARANYWLGGHVRESDRRARLEQGIDAGRRAVALAPDRPEGHFWFAANMGALAETGGFRLGLKYRKAIKEELETLLRIDPAFEQGSADRALGRWYFKVPGLFGGSLERAEQHLRASLAYNPDSTASHFFLAELMLKTGRRAEARNELQSVLNARSLDPNWAPEDREFKARSKAMLATIK